MMSPAEVEAAFRKLEIIRTSMIRRVLDLSRELLEFDEFVCAIGFAVSRRDNELIYLQSVYRRYCIHFIRRQGRVQEGILREIAHMVDALEAA